jgi:2-(1,2-epoxy-1,2-dihydrophenyl)acetyl-CoA isomerase
MFEVSNARGICEVLLNKPAKKNALRDEEFVSLTGIANEIAASSARAVIFHGAGNCFSAGKDIGNTDPLSVDAEKLIVETVNPLFLAIAAIPVPTIAAIEGPCLGGGFGIAFSCDIVLAGEGAKMGSAFRALGAVPDSGIHFFLRDRLGHHRAAELLYTGRMLSGREAADIGLINRAVPDGAALAEARVLAAQIAAGPTVAFKATKRILAETRTLPEALAAEAVWQGRVFRSSDSAEGFAAFQQKRKPVFRGS